MNEDVWPPKEATPRKTHLIPGHSTNGTPSLLKVQIFYEKDILSVSPSSRKKRKGSSEKEKLQFESIGSSSGFEMTANWLEEENGDFFLADKGLVADSSVRRKRETCSICRTEVEVSKRRQHLYSKHLHTKRFQCPFCPFSSAYHRQNVEVHIRQVHNKSISALENEEITANDVNMWMYRCFGDLKILRFLDSDVTAIVFDLVDRVCNGPISKKTPRLEESSSCKMRKPISCKLCNLQKIRHLQRHILQYHLQKPVFLCPYCHYASNYARNAVKEHIRSIHSLSGDFVEDIRDQYWSSMEDLSKQCFPCTNNPNDPIPNFL